MHAVYIKSICGISNEAVGKLVDLDRDTVSLCIKTYIEGGIGALCFFNYGTNKSELAEHSESIMESLKQRPPMSLKEAKARIEEMTGIDRSITQISTFIQSHGLRYIKAGHIPAKADTQRQKQWVQTVLDPAIEQAKRGESILLFMDAAHFILEPFVCALWCVARLFIKASAGRNRINVLGAVNAITKEVISMTNTTFINADTIVDFLKQLKTHYGDLPIKIVLDNARYQHCKLVEQAASQLGITLLFLPPYSPNLNIIERLWKFTKKEILYAKYYDSPASFHSAITSFFSTVSQKQHLALKNLLSLKFQFFENQNAEIYPL